MGSRGDAIDSGVWRTAPQPFQKCALLFFIAFRPDFDIAIAGVSNPARQSKRTGRVLTCVSKPNALHPSGNTRKKSGFSHALPLQGSGQPLRKTLHISAFAALYKETQRQFDSLRRTFSITQAPFQNQARLSGLFGLSCTGFLSRKVLPAVCWGCRPLEKAAIASTVQHTVHH